MSEQAKSEMSEQQAKHLRMLEDIFKRDRHIAELEHSLSIAERELKASKEPVCSVCAGDKEHAAKINCICGGIGTEWAELEGLRRELAELRREVSETRKTFAAEVIARLDKVEADSSERYKTPSFRVIQNVCSDLKWFVGELLKKPTTPHEVNHEPERG